MSLFASKRKSAARNAARQSSKLVDAGLSELTGAAGKKDALLLDSGVRNSVAVQEALHDLRQAIVSMDAADEDEGDGEAGGESPEAGPGGPSETRKSKGAMGSTRSLIAAAQQLSEVQQVAEAVRAERAASLAPGGAVTAAVGAVASKAVSTVSKAAKESSSVQYRPVPKIVKSQAKGAADGSVAPLTRHDLLFGETATIDGLWIYDYAIDVDALRAGLERFLGEAPLLAGRLDKGRGGVRHTNEGVPFYVQYANGSFEDIDEDPSPRSDWVDKPKLADIWAGRAPIMTVVLTLLREGGCVLGVYVSHGVAGGAGWFGTCMPRLAAMVKAEADAGPQVARKAGDAPPPLPQAGLGSVAPLADRSALPKGRYSKQEVQRMVREELPFKPLDFTDPLIGETKRKMYYWLLTIATDRPRVLVHFSKQELDSIKDAVLEDCAGRVDWLSTGEALAAHLSQVLDEIAPIKTVRFNHVALIVDHIGFLKHMPKGVMANTFYLYSAPLPDNAADMGVGDIAVVLHNRMREITKSPDEMLRQMDLQEDVIANRYQPSPNLDGSLAVVPHNQSKFKPLVQLDFGQGVSHRYVPHPAGDSMLFCPAKDGGIDCWLSTVNGIIGNPERLREPEFQELIHKYA